MPTIPAAPGWYLEETDDDSTSLDPIIAWETATDTDGDDILLPYVSGGPGAAPFLITAVGFEYCNRNVIYRPNHDPATAP